MAEPEDIKDGSEAQGALPAVPAKGKASKSKKPEIRKRELKSAKRKDGVPALKKGKRKKKIFWIGGGLVVAFFSAVFLVPKIGTLKYGICKTYIEMHDSYPSFLEYVEGYESGNQVIIDYNRVDSFGQRSLNQIRCSFNPDPKNDAEIVKVDVNGKSNILPQESPEMIKPFNKGTISLLKNKPSLVMPEGLPKEIKDYR